MINRTATDARFCAPGDALVEEKAGKFIHRLPNVTRSTAVKSSTQNDTKLCSLYLVFVCPFRDIS